VCRVWCGVLCVYVGFVCGVRVFVGVCGVFVFGVRVWWLCVLCVRGLCCGMFVVCLWCV